MAPRGRLPIDHDRLADFCRRWQIAELSLFGSVLRDDFHPTSDVDVLVSFEPSAEWGVLDHIAMQEELTGLFGRRVDLVSRRAVERSPNHLRRDAILSSIERLISIETVRPSSRSQRGGDQPAGVAAAAPALPNRQRPTAW